MMAASFRHVGVLGLGHVGLPTALGFAELGWSVIGTDSDTGKVERIASGQVPFFEPQLPELLKRHLASGRFRVYKDIGAAVRDADVLFICVGTPQKPDGSADLSQVDAVIRTVAENLNGYKLIVEKSTVPVRTAQWIKRTIARYAGSDADFEVASNPEFLREGMAVWDFFHPDRIVIGVESDRAKEWLLTLYEPLNAPIVVTDLNTAELIKHAANAFLALKISFINMIADLCEVTDADVTEVAKGIGLDHRIGPQFLQAGIGYGGYCLLPEETLPIRDEEGWHLVTAERLWHHFRQKKTLHALSWDGMKMAPVSILTLGTRDYRGEIVTLQTTMGRQVRVTADHPIPIWAGKEIQVKPAKEVREGEELMLPLRLRVGERFFVANPRGRLFYGLKPPARTRLFPLKTPLTDKDPNDLKGLGAPGTFPFTVGGGGNRFPDEFLFGHNGDGYCLPAPFKTSRDRTMKVLRLKEKPFKMALSPFVFDLPPFLLGDETVNGAKWGHRLWTEFTTVDRSSAEIALLLFQSFGLVVALQMKVTSKETTYILRPVVEDPSWEAMFLGNPFGYRRYDGFATVRVTGIVCEFYEGPVYSVETENGYFVTGQGLLLHNCLPKDLKAFIRIAEENQVDFSLLKEVERINEGRVDRFIRKVKEALWVLKGKVLAVWGLSFKPNTDDIREAPSLKIVARLLEEGAFLRLYDPQAIPEFRKVFPEMEQIRYFASAYEAVEGAEALLVLTEWEEFKGADWSQVREKMRLPIVVDGRNCLNPKELCEMGFEYCGMGRGRFVPGAVSERPPSGG